MLIGLRRGDLLRLRMGDITDAGIKVTPRKTANTTGISRCGPQKLNTPVIRSESYREDDRR